MTCLSDKIIGLRGVKVISQLDLAKAVPISTGYLSLMEKGKYTNPGMKILKGLAKALDVSIDYLADDSFAEYRSWEKVAVDESMRLFFSKHKLSAEDLSGFKRISFQPTAPRTVAEWERLLNNIDSFRKKSPDSNPKSRKNTVDDMVLDSSSEDEQDEP